MKRFNCYYHCGHFFCVCILVLFNYCLSIEINSKLFIISQRAQWPPLTISYENLILNYLMISKLIDPLKSLLTHVQYFNRIANSRQPSYSNNKWLKSQVCRFEHWKDTTDMNPFTNAKWKRIYIMKQWIWQCRRRIEIETFEAKNFDSASIRTHKKSLWPLVWCEKIIIITIYI